MSNKHNKQACFRQTGQDPTSFLIVFDPHLEPESLNVMDYASTRFCLLNVTIYGVRLV